MKINLTFLLHWVKSSLSFRAKQSAWHIINNNYLSVKGMGAFWFRKLGKNLTWVVTYLLITEWICEATLEKRRERTQCMPQGSDNLKWEKGFLAISVVKNLPANAGDAGLILVRENPTCHGATKPNPQLLKSTCPRACAPQQEKPLRWEAHAVWLESSLCSLQLEKSPHSTKDPEQPKINE